MLKRFGKKVIYLLIYKLIYLYSLQSWWFDFLLNQIRKLNFIRSQVGFCRAWLRIALNEAALSSYLSSLVNTSEYKTFLNRYYKTYALFRDHEQVSVFMSFFNVFLPTLTENKISQTFIVLPQFFCRRFRVGFCCKRYLSIQFL